MMKHTLVFVVIVLASNFLCISADIIPHFSSVKGASTTAIYDTPSTTFFQLQAQSNGKCLELTNNRGIYVDCSDHRSTIFFLNGDRANYRNIVILGTDYCLDRQHCHSSTSNLRHSACNHCGAVHWDIRCDGSVREDDGKNCIYSKCGNEAAVQHCSNGFERFNVLVLGDRFLIKSVAYGDCVGGGEFVNCDCAPTFYVTGLPRNYNIKLYVPGDNNGNICLDREHCHSATSNLRFSECSHCGATHWSIEGYEIGEDELKNCITRGSNNETLVSHCSDGYEKLSYEIIPPPIANAQNEETTLIRYFPDPNITEYITLDLTRGCRGIKIFQYRDQNGSYTVEVEIVHFLSSNFNYLGYDVCYMVTYIHTNIPYDSHYTNQDILKRLSTDPSHVTQINIRYGGIGTNRNIFDGLASEFLTNSGPHAGAQLPQGYHVQTVINIYNGFSSATNSWSQSETRHAGRIQGVLQTFLYIISQFCHRPLYWNNNHYCGHLLKTDGYSVL